MAMYYYRRSNGTLYASDRPTKENNADTEATQSEFDTASLKAAVSAKRYNVEIAGINFTYRTVPVPISTNRESQVKIDAARNMVRDAVWIDGSNWKCLDGIFRPFTSVEITNLCTAVRTHIKECYDVEAAKFLEIDATGITDVNTGWPSTANTPMTIYFNGQ